jgi:hypothetical protein
MSAETLILTGIETWLSTVHPRREPNPVAHTLLGVL